MLAPMESGECNEVARATKRRRAPAVVDTRRNSRWLSAGEARL